MILDNCFTVALLGTAGAMCLALAAGTVTPELPQGNYDTFAAGQPLVFPTGEHEPLEYTLEFDLAADCDWEKLVLYSNVPNHWWGVDAVEVSFRDSASGAWSDFRHYDWFSLDPQHDDGPEFMVLTVPVPAEVKPDAARVKLQRRHPHVWMRLDGIRAVVRHAPFDAADLVTVSTPDQAGNAPRIFDGASPVWAGGDDCPPEIVLDVNFPAPRRVFGATLVSNAINKFWSVDSVTLEGRTPAGQWLPLTQAQWYTRDQGGPEVAAAIETLDREWTPVELAGLRVRLTRPHQYYWLSLAGLKLKCADTLSAKFAGNWQMYYPGQTVKFYCDLVNTHAEALRDLTFNVYGGDQLLYTEQLELPVGATALRPEFPAPATPGEFRWKIELRDADGQFLLAASRPETTRVVPKSSKYFLPIGTCHGNPELGALGINTAHYWSLHPAVNPAEQSSDPYANDFRNGYRASTCGESLTFLADAKRTNEQGQTFERGGFGVPLRMNDIQRDSLRYWDGHPGLGELVYYNEDAMESWGDIGLVDYNEFAIAFYRERLKEWYGGDIAAMNALYGTTYADFAAVEPPRDFPGPNPAWFDWNRARQALVAAHFNEYYDLMKAEAPYTKITPKPINFDLFWVTTALDPWLLKDHVDVYGYDLYLFQRDGYFDAALSLDYHRTQVRPKRLELLETQIVMYEETTPEEKELNMNLAYWPAFMRGLSGATFYCLSEPWSDTFNVPYWITDLDGALRPNGIETMRLVKGFQNLMPIFATGQPAAAEIAVLFPLADVVQSPNIAPLNALRGAYKLLHENQWQCDIISVHNIAAGELANYKVLLLPMARHLSAETVGAIREFVAAGGVIVGDLECGVYDEHHQTTHALDEVFGVRISDREIPVQSFELNGVTLETPAIQTTPSVIARMGEATTAPLAAATEIELAGAQALARFDQGAPAVTVNEFGRGKAVYFAAPFFAGSRNYFYNHDLNGCVGKCTRETELALVSKPERLGAFAALLASCGIAPQAELALDAADRRFIHVARFGTPDCMITSFTNWGDGDFTAVPVTVQLPEMKQIRQLLRYDTYREEWTELPFTFEDGVLQATLPRLERTQLLVAIDQFGPVTVTARRLPDGAVTATVTNHLPEPVVGELVVRIDQRTEALSDAVKVELAPGASRDYRLTVREPAPELLRDPRGRELPWYVWLTWDGDLRSFGKIEK